MAAKIQIMPAHHPFVKVVAEALRRRCGVKKGDRLVVAVSGGADSVALLLALSDVAPRRTWRLELSVAHVQHHLREAQDDAEQDAEFVTQLAKRLNLVFMRADLDLSECRGNLEAQARRHRYAALGNMAAQFGAEHVVVAHHADDQMETVLMRLLRGASVKGLSGMAWRRRLAPDSLVTLLRPMLAVDRAAVLGLLQDMGQTWREDRTNTDMTRVRARLRQQVLPVLHAIRADAPQQAVRLGEHLRQVARWFDQTIDKAAKDIVSRGRDTTLDRTAARQLPRVVLGAVLRRLLMAAGCRGDKLGHRAMGPLLTAIRDRQGGQRHFKLGTRSHVVVKRDVVLIQMHEDTK